MAARSWKMSDETKKWVICGHSPEDQASLLKQIADAEGQKKIQYLISVPGCYYEIEPNFATELIKSVLGIVNYDKTTKN